MKTHLGTKHLALGLTLSIVLSACGSSGSTQAAEPAPLSSTGRVVEASAGRTAAVVGTVIDAATRKPLAGAQVEGPGGLTAQSDASGRFQLNGFPAGTQGELTVLTDAGLSGSVRLRPLAAGNPLEVVVHVR